jgi:dihydrofolate reductase
MSGHIALIWAQASNGVIGKDGGMPWHLPEDLAHFKELTLGSPVVMGRRTWDSLDPRFRPLPGRRNVVVTRDRSWAAEGAEASHSVDDALALVAADDTVWIIGGAQIFAAALPIAGRIEVTEIDEPFDGDTFAPAIDDSWRVATTEPADGWSMSRVGLPYRFLRYERVSRRSGA